MFIETDRTIRIVHLEGFLRSFRYNYSSTGSLINILRSLESDIRILDSVADLLPTTSTSIEPFFTRELI